MIKSHSKSINKILRALQDLPADQHSQSGHNLKNYAGLAVLVSWQFLKGFQDFVHTFSMALYHKWNVKNDFAFVLQFFSFISDGLGSVIQGFYFQDICFYCYRTKDELLLTQVGIGIFLTILHINPNVSRSQKLFTGSVSDQFTT